MSPFCRMVWGQLVTSEWEADCVAAAAAVCCCCVAEYLSTAADLDSAPDAPSRRRSSSSSTSSRLSKDQLPILGLTVNVPSAAATAAAQMSAASKAAEAAAAAAAAAKARPGHADGDVVEAAAATEGLRLNAAAHIIPHVDKVGVGAGGCCWWRGRLW